MEFKINSLSDVNQRKCANPHKFVWILDFHQILLSKNNIVATDLVCKREFQRNVPHFQIEPTQYAQML